MRVELEGEADDVRQRLGMEEESRTEPQGQDASETIISALADAQNAFTVKRTWPGQVDGVDVPTFKAQVHEGDCPYSYRDIIQEVQDEHGGGKYHMRIFDQDTNKTVAADKFKIDGAVILPEGAGEVDDEERRRVWARQGKSEEEVDRKKLEEEGEYLDAQIRLEQRQQRLDELKARRAGNGKQPQKSVDDDRIAELERQIAQDRHDARVEALRREHKEEMSAVLKKLDEIEKRPAKEEGKSEIVMLIEQMREDRKSNESQFNSILKQMQDDKMNAVLEEIKALKNKPQKENEGIREYVSLFKDLGILDTGREEGDDPDMPWEAKLIERHLPKLFDLIGERREEGRPMTRQEIMGEVDKLAKQAEDEAVARARQRALEDRQRQGISQQQQQRQQAPPAGEKSPSSPQTQKTPPPQPNPTQPPADMQHSAVPGGAVPAPAPASPESSAEEKKPEERKLPTVQEEIAMRAAGILTIIEREIEIRPNEYVWNLEGVWETAPESLREKLCMALDPIAMIDVFSEIEVINKEGLEQLKAKIAGDEKIKAWLQLGLTELREWAEEKAKDPSFNPLGDEEEGEEEAKN